DRAYAPRADACRVVGEAPDDGRAGPEEESFQLLNDELARCLGEIACAALCDEEHVLEPDAADDRVVHPGLDRDDVAHEERRRARSGDPGRLVDLESDPVAGRVDEATRRRIGRVLLLSGTHRVVAGSPDEVLDKLVDLASGHTRTECLDAGVLRPTNE